MNRIRQILSPEQRPGWLLQAIFGFLDHKSLLGDLHEMAVVYARDYGRVSAAFWYWRQLFKVIPKLTYDIIYWSFVMLKNYLMIAIRTLLKQKGFTIINALGLSIGIGSALFITAIIQNEYSFDDFQENMSRIYRVTDKIHIGPGQISHTATTPVQWGPAIEADFPEVEAAVRFLPAGHQVKYNDLKFREFMYYTDPGIFNIFSFKMLKGDPEVVLNEPYSLVLTPEVAKRFFGDEEPIGKVLNFDDEHDYTVTGIMEKIPQNSYFQFDMLVSISTADENLFENFYDWRSHWIDTFILLREDAAPDDVQARFPGFIKKYIDAEFQKRYEPVLQPLAEVHFSDNLNGNNGETLDPLYIYIFEVIGFFILIIACINFMNLSTAKSSGRAREVGIRKVLGAFKTQLARQFLLETLLVTIIALGFGLVFAELAFPWFNALTERSVSIDYLNDWFYLGAIVLITLFVALSAGGYPAIFLSSFMPVKVLKGDLSSGSRNKFLRKFLVVTQFSVAVFMIIANIILYQQLEFMKSSDLGFQRKDILMFNSPEQKDTSRMMNLKERLLSYPEVISVAYTSSEPGDGFMYGRFIPEGSNVEDGMMLPHISAGYDYFSTLDLDIVAGRAFSFDNATDTSKAVIINETAARRFGWDDPIGKTIRLLNLTDVPHERTVIGVVKDYHYESLHTPIRPLIIHSSPNQMFSTIVRTEGGDLKALGEKYGEVWRDLEPERQPFWYNLDLDLELEYRFEGIIGDMVIKFSIVTIFIACLGLLGLAAFTAQQRTREIGVRKVMGATSKEIVMLLSKEFLKYVVYSNLIAWPLAYFAMSQYLRIFAYQTSMNIMIFILSGVISVTIAWFTVSFNALRAARANPVNTLRQD